MMDVVEGEHLVKDATSQIIYRFTIVGVLTDAFSFERAIGQFVLSSLGGILIGFMGGMGRVTALPDHDAVIVRLRWRYHLDGTGCQPVVTGSERAMVGEGLRLGDHVAHACKDALLPPINIFWRAFAVE